MEKLSRLLVLGICSASCATSALAKTAACTDPFLFDSKPVFGLQDFSRLSTTHSSELDEVFGFWIAPFDQEDHPMKDGRLAIAVVYAGRYGIAEPVIGGIIWSRRFAKWDQEKSSQMTKAGNAEFAVFTLDDPKAACPNREFVVKFDHDKVLWADGKKIGQLPPD